jgi:hypothetical protein
VVTARNAAGTVAEGIAGDIAVAENTVTPVSVNLIPAESGAGTFSYDISLPGDMTLVSGFLWLASLSGGVNPAPVDLTGGLNGTLTLDSGYYRMTFEIFADTPGGGKSVRRVAVVHISPNLVTEAAYHVDDECIDTEFFIVGNSGELNSALSAIQSSTGANFIISVAGSFSAPPVSLTGAGYDGKTVTLSSGGGVFTLTLNGTGSLFTVGSSSTADFRFILRDINLSGGSANTAPLVKVEGGALVVNGGAKIMDNTNTGNGGGVYISSGTVELEGGAISGNTAGRGGGVYVAGGSFKLTGGSIDNNQAYLSATSTATYTTHVLYGGGVYMEDGSFEMNGGSINNNRAWLQATSTRQNSRLTVNVYGGGVSVAGGSFIMNDGDILENTAESRIREEYSGSNADISSYPYAYGGGIHIRGGSFESRGGAIRGNTVVSYAFAYYDNTTTTKCYAYGGGIHISNSGAVQMSGGSVSGNTGTLTHAGSASWGSSVMYGGGVYIDANISTLSGSFTKTPGAGGTSGVIYGSNETGIGGDGHDLKNTAASGGHAVYYGASPAKIRNTTVDETCSLSTADTVTNWTD